MTKREPIYLREPIVFDKQSNCPYEEPYGYIYKYTNKINGHYYIGKHKYNETKLDKSYWGSGEKPLQSAYKKYGKKNFTREILYWSDKDNDDLNEKEIIYIDVFHAYENPVHYNLTPGGDGYILNEQQRKEFSDRVSGENNYFYGVHMYGKDAPNYGNYWSDEQKENLSKKLTGRKQSEEEREKRKIISKTSENCKKQLEELHSLDDLSDRISNGLKSSEKFQKAVRENNKKKRIPVGKYSNSGELLETYESIKHASRCGYSEPGIQACLKGNLKTSGGFIWKRLDERIN